MVVPGAAGARLKHEVFTPRPKGPDLPSSMTED